MALSRRLSRRALAALAPVLPNCPKGQPPKEIGLAAYPVANENAVANRALRKPGQAPCGLEASAERYPIGSTHLDKLAKI